jgi:pimeloyl-ACP methyl ester carboxylesterase
MAEPLPVVLVHGAWHGAWCWSKQLSELDRRGIEAVAVDLPGHGSSPEPFGDLYGDAATVAAAVAAVGPAVVVGHSYGGMAITEADYADGLVAHLVYLTAFCPDVGESAADLAASLPPPTVQARTASDGTGLIHLDRDGCVDALYSDCHPADISEALGRLGPQPALTFTQPVTRAAWRSAPTTYVLCTEDHLLVPEAQRIMSKRCGRVVELAAGHSPFLSMPGAVADVIEPLARGGPS